MKNTEIRELALSDLQERVQTEKTNYSRMKLEHAISPLENLSKIKLARRNIARMLTEVKKRQINAKN